MEDGTQAFALSSAAAYFFPDLPKTKVNSSSDLRGFFQQAFTDWMVRGNYETFSSRFVDPRKSNSLFAELNYNDEGIKAAFQSWQLRDHGLAAKHEHGLVTAEPRKSLLQVTQNPSAIVKYENLAAAMIPVTKEDTSTVLTLTVQGGVYMGFGKFRHAPNDTVALIAESRSGKLSIVDLRWVVDW